jgi:hypothetical protein
VDGKRLVWTSARRERRRKNERRGGNRAAFHAVPQRAIRRTTRFSAVSRARTEAATVRNGGIRRDDAKDSVDLTVVATVSGDGELGNARVGVVGGGGAAFDSAVPVGDGSVEYRRRDLCNGRKQRSVSKERREENTKNASDAL